MVLPEIDIGVLGPVVIRGMRREFTRAASRELVVYLAFHRMGVATGTWSTALWPSTAPALSTVHSTASDARRALGCAADGGEHLPRSGRRLRLRPSVGTDVEHFASLASGPDLVGCRLALGLIRGPLFDGLTLADWTVFEGIQAEVTSLVVQTALTGAWACCRQQNGAEAEWMIRQALRVDPYDERLHRALLRATALQGNRTGLRTAMRQLLVIAGETAGSAIGTQIHPETLTLYRELTDGRVPVARGSSVRL